MPPEDGTEHLTRLAAYVESLPAAWKDADQEQRNQLACLIYEEVWVDGPRLLYVKPRPEVAPLFQIRDGAAQPTRHAMSELSTTVRSGDPDGERGRMIQQWDFPVDEPVSLPEWRHDRLVEHLPAIAMRIERGETLRMLSAEHALSHEALRQALKQAGYVTRPTLVPATPPRRSRARRLPGRGRSTALTPDEVAPLLACHRAGESLRSLARRNGVSHETMRRALAQAATVAANVASA